MTPPSLEHRLAARERPPGSQVMYQSWTHLLFLHWRWDAADLQKRLPPGLTVDTFDGSAWLGVVPFFMRNIRPRFVPSMPWFSNFLEKNVRTYVHDEQGRPGVWFFSLDCNQPFAVWTARTFFHLPYQHSRMKARIADEWTVHYTNHRHGDTVASAFRYTLSKETTLAEPGTLEFFLVERYLLFASSPQGLRIGRVYHPPYPIARAEATEFDTRILKLNDFSEPGTPPDHVCGSPGVNVLIYPLQ
ncbi:hypothetical protein AYO49_01310 [Verrucomicrobiaceae bacterium SCGC AG-212-N21]|nr:hypothetical protein AYO49_01310 [Verrucomicrobiaceae bacterium SCGC AG-212-N21]